MPTSLRAGLYYFAIVFGIGFVLGTIRVLAIVPTLGELTVVLIELPIMLGAAWIVCRRLVSACRVPHDLGSRIGMGAAAFALLMLAELALSVWLIGNTIDAHLAGYRTAHGALGLAGQVVFASFPALQLRSRP